MRTLELVAENVEHAPTVKESEQEPTNEAILHAMLRVLERVAGAQTRANSRGTIVGRLHLSKVELFRGIFGITATVAEYWLEAIEMILDYMECTLKQKLNGIVSLLRDEAYSWW